jgi:hypothetical protein
LSIFTVLLGCVTLLLKELKFALPQSLITVVSVIKILVLTIELSEFLLLLLDLLLNECFITIESLHELVIGFLQSGDLGLSDLA